MVKVQPKHIKLIYIRDQLTKTQRMIYRKWVMKKNWTLDLVLFKRNKVADIKEDIKESFSRPITKLNSYINLNRSKITV